MRAKRFLYLSMIASFLGSAPLPLQAQMTVSDLDARKEAVKLKPSDAPARLYLGDAYADSGQYREAAAAYGEAVRLNPGFAEAYVKLGDACVKLRQEKDAIDAYRAAVKIKPEDARAHFKLAAVCLDIEEEDCFTEEFEVVEKLDTKLADELRTLFKDKFGEEFTPGKKGQLKELLRRR